MLYELLEMLNSLQASITESTKRKKQLDELIKPIHHLKEVEVDTGCEEEDSDNEEEDKSLE